MILKPLRPTIIIFLVLITGCWSQDGARSPLPGTVGSRGEVLVVCSDGVWAGEVGASLRSALQMPYPVLPQMQMENYEPMFDLVHKPLEDFNKFWKPHRNVIIIDIADRKDIKEPSFKFYKDRYATGQTFIEGKARTQHELALIISDRALEMESYIHKREVARSAGINRLSTDDALEREVLEATGVSIAIPKGSYGLVVDSVFTWLDRQQTRLKGSNNHDVQQGVFIHSEPYTGPEQFELTQILDRRDEVTRDNVSGPTDGSYMSVERRLQPTYEEITYDGVIAAEVKGLWRMENDFMGGPFYSLTIYHEKSASLITVEGYTYAPYFDKREYMREIEGIVKTTKLLN
tara:strand:+ start:540 stop:1580 length:1041 start_codon:yes stop_codon:yes gene_type:complete